MDGGADDEDFMDANTSPCRGTFICTVICKDHITVEGEKTLWLLAGTHHSLDPQDFLLAREGPQDWVAYKEGKGVM